MSPFERRIVSETGAWRGLLYPTFLVGLAGGAYIKTKKPHALNSAVMTRLRRMALGGFGGTVTMELAGENYLLGERLPVGFFKWQYARLHPFKLYLSTNEVDEYWRHHHDEKCWRFELGAMGTLEEFNSGVLSDLSQKLSRHKLTEHKTENPIWAEYLDKFNKNDKQ